MQVAVIGAGPAGMIAAEVLAQGGATVTIYERMPSVGRKFLMAGRGGLNLTHSEDFDAFIARYGDAAPQLRAAIEAFPPEALRAWCEALGQKTFVGSSGRIFPESFKASPLLRAWLRRLDAQGVRIAARHHWKGWRDGALLFSTPRGEIVKRPDATVFALGGASWPRLGADGGWVDFLRQNGVDIAPLCASNAGVRIGWSEIFRDRFHGQPLKNIAITIAGKSLRGEAMVTRDGLEGGAVYALSPMLREAMRQSEPILHVNLMPDSTQAKITSRLAKRKSIDSLSNALRKVTLSPTAIGLLQEAAHRTKRNLASMSNDELAALITACPVPVAGIASLDRAISTAGGIAFGELDARLMLTKMPGVFVAGEMLDWDAPTGGYLLQACFATGVAAGQGALAWINC